MPTWKSLRAHLLQDGYKYAFDTLVVILGILIAFSLDNWYEKIKRKNLSRSYAVALISDLKGDLREVREIMGHMQESIIRIDSLADYTRNAKIGDLSNLDLFPLAMGDNPYRPYSWNRTTIDDLKQSGILGEMGNASLSEKIAGYEAFTRHLDEDYKYDLQTRQQVSTLSDAIVNLNYGNFDVIAPEYANHNKLILDYHFNTTQDYATAQKDSLTLLTDDINRVHEMVNGYLRLRFFLNIRGNHELPRLISRAEELIDILEREYL